jgi:hypothetical protein
MIGARAGVRLTGAALAALAIGAVGCIVGAALFGATGFFRAWLCGYLLWLGLPLAGVTLVMVHDLTGGEWMATARPVLDAAIATMPIATLAGIPAFVDLHALYSWTHPAANLNNVFYLNPMAFYIRYGSDVVLWNLLAAFALWAPRGDATPIPPALSWLSGIGLILLAFSVGFASIDWVMSLLPTFWSSVFSYAIGASWFNTGMAVVVLFIALFGWPAPERRGHMSKLCEILLGTTIFWAYVEFMQFLIIWEENLKTEIPWYLYRLAPDWKPAIYVAAALGFVVPFLVLLWAPSKHHRGVVASVCLMILVSRVAEAWWLVLPQFSSAGPFWIDVAAILALGGLVALPFVWALRHPERLGPGGAWLWKANHG